MRREEAEAVDEGGMGGMQSGSRKSKIEKSGTHSSMLAYLTKSKRAGWSDRGRSSAKEKKRASKEARQHTVDYVLVPDDDLAELDAQAVPVLCERRSHGCSV